MSPRLVPTYSRPSIYSCPRFYAPVQRGISQRHFWRLLFFKLSCG